MNFLRKQNSAIAFMVAVTMTLTFINSFSLVQIKAAVDDIEPIIIECNCPPVVEQTVEIVEPTEATDEVAEELPPRIDCPLDDETQQMILERCEELNLDFAFVMAVIYTESSFRANADSGSSVGLMQINRVNHGWLSKELGLTDFFNPEQNVKAGTYMLLDLFDKYDDPAKVLMAYNMGEAGARRLWNKGIYTTNYVEKVFARQDLYNQQIMERTM